MKRPAPGVSRAATTCDAGTTSRLTALRSAALGIAFVAASMLLPGAADAGQKPAAASASAAGSATAVFAGGCFWCVESDFDAVPGVTATVSGYTGGTTANPTYKQVGRQDTGHYEAVEITYDPAKVSYATLVDFFLHNVDPTDADGQFCDRGPTYRTAIFVADPQQRAAAEAAKTAADRQLNGKVVTPILEAKTFYPAEDYHQNYHVTNALKYKYYRWSCGRDARVEEVWKGAAPAS